jgi:hypothetical protein
MPAFFGFLCLQLEPDGQSLEVSHLIPRTTAAEPAGNDETTKTVNAARTTIRSGLVIDCLPLTHPERQTRIRRPAGSKQECIPKREGHKHPLALIEGATENVAVVQALIDNLIERGLDPKVCRLFIIDGAKALSKVIRRTFGAHTPIQRCQLHKARNVIERLPKPLHASVRRALRQAWELDDADESRAAVAQSRPSA